MKIAWETVVIAAIGIADLVTTLIWVAHQGAQEANPLFAHYLKMGPAYFAVMKLVLLAAPLFLLEWARRRRPHFTRWASRFAIIGYLAMYAVGVYRVNGPAYREIARAQAINARYDVERERLFESVFSRAHTPARQAVATAATTATATAAMAVPVSDRRLP